MRCLLIIFLFVRLELSGYLLIEVLDGWFFVRCQMIECLVIDAPKNKIYKLLLLSRKT